jgi:hydrogenase/urease accessory protein HupE
MEGCRPPALEDFVRGEEGVRGLDSVLAVVAVGLLAWT